MQQAGDRPRRRIRLLVSGVALLATGALLIPNARAQNVALPAGESTLREVTEQLKRQTGYEFHLALNKELEEVRHPVPTQRKPLSAALTELAALFHCDFFSLDAAGFYVVATPKPEEVETTAGAYRLRVGRVTETDQTGVLQLTLQFAAADEAGMEAIAGVSGLQAQDNFGRSLLQDKPLLRTTSGTRVRLTEYWQRVPLFLKDDRAVRIRSVRGNLVLFRKVTPLRFEFPVSAAAMPAARSQEGLEFRLDHVNEADGRWTLDTRLSWKAERTVMGQGLSRTPQPYLVDESGHIYRDVAARTARYRSPDGSQVLEEHLRFDGLDAKPARLVYDVYLKEDPGVVVPFRVGALPLPGSEGSGPSAGLRSFTDTENGGTLTLEVLDRDGKPAEGEVSLGISRKEDEGWTGPRWLDLITDAEGRIRLEHLRAGQYRVVRLYRQDPSLPPLTPSRAPVEVTVPAKGETALPALRLSVPGM